jgi:hypothetical protein
LSRRQVDHRRRAPSVRWSTLATAGRIKRGLSVTTIIRERAPDQGGEHAGARSRPRVCKNTKLISQILILTKFGQQTCSESNYMKVFCPVFCGKFVGHELSHTLDPLLTVMSVSFRTRQFDRAHLVLRPPKRNPPRGVLLAFGRRAERASTRDSLGPRGSVPQIGA